jgi:hypothetical protein
VENEMKLTKNILTENKVYNPYNLAQFVGEKVYISFQAQERGRISHSAKWQVVGINFKTDPEEAYYNYGHKTFTIWEHDKETQLLAARAWVKEKYGMDMTERDVWGNWHVTGTMDKMKAIIQGNIK